MWHEARRQEKLLRNTMIDQSKRAERKRRYFENVRKDPEQFMQIHGRKAQIHADLAIARAAEDSNILRPWQGDPTITIDRFDVRSHLSKMDLMDDDDILPKKKQDQVVDEKEQIVTDFERYRVLIINDYKGVTEKQYLRKIADREFWHKEKEHSRKVEAEKKKKSAEKKSTIGFSYEDSEVVKGSKSEEKEEEEPESEDEMEDMNDLDVDLDTAHLNPETQRVVNKSGEEFGVRRGLFCALQRADQQALKDAAELKKIDRQKAQLSGRESKHERMLLRQQRQAIVGKGAVVHENGATATLLGFINKSQQKSKIDEIIEDMEGSDDDDDRRARPEFITTFGGAPEKDSDDEEKKGSVGPVLPSEEYRKILKLSKNRSNDEEVDWGSLKRRSRTRSPPRRSRSGDRTRRRRSSRSRSRSRSRDRRRSRSRSRDRRRRSSRSRSRDRRRRSRSKDRRRSRSRSKDRRRRRSTSRRRRDRSTSRRRRSTSRRRDRSRGEKRKKSPEKREDTPERKRSPSKSPPKIVSSEEESAGEDVKMLEIRSSMSDSEKERCEIENRKRRVKLTKKMVKEKRGQAPDARSSDEEDEEETRKAEMAKRVKQQMSQALKKTRKELAKGEEERKREQEVAQRVRDELRYIELQERRERERTKMRREGRSPRRASKSP